MDGFVCEKIHLSMYGPTVLVPDTAEEVDTVPVVAGQVLHVRERVQALLVGGEGGSHSSLC